MWSDLAGLTAGTIPMIELPWGIAHLKHFAGQREAPWCLHSSCSSSKDLPDPKPSSPTLLLRYQFVFLFIKQCRKDKNQSKTHSKDREGELSFINGRHEGARAARMEDVMQEGRK